MGSAPLPDLVRIAEDVRQSLTGSPSPVRLASLQVAVEVVLDEVRSTCRAEGITPEQLPVSIRQAYQYLAAVDWPKLESDAAAVPDNRRRSQGRKR